jgi:hypothetical protein
MQPFRAKLTDDAGGVIAEVEGSIQSPEEASGGRQGWFEFADGSSFFFSGYISESKSTLTDCERPAYDKKRPGTSG